jgi:XRE family transcriptional regulator, regulator of sulfur utilization
MSPIAGPEFGLLSGTMMPRSEIHDRLAASLRAARKARGLSLDAVAKLSGVSRSMVSQIERGESSPTVATLWNLTQALQVDFAGLLEGRPSPGIEVVRAEAAPVIGGRGRDLIIRILSPAEAVGEHEVYDLTFGPGGGLVSDPHSPGCRESLTVISGHLRVVSGDEAQVLGPGDTARYPADRAHEINAEGGAARAILIVQDS